MLSIQSLYELLSVAQFPVVSSEKFHFKMLSCPVRDKQGCMPSARVYQQLTLDFAYGCDTSKNGGAVSGNRMARLRYA